MSDYTVYVKFVSIFFVSFTTFIGIVVSLTGYFIYRHNKNEIELAKLELREWMYQQREEMNYIWSENTKNAKNLNHQLNMTLLEFSIETNDSSNVYVLLSRLMPTATRDDLPALSRARSLELDTDTHELLLKLMGEAKKY